MGAALGPRSHSGRNTAHPPPPAFTMMMLHLIPPALIMCLGEVIGQPGGYGLTERAYVYLEKQDLGKAVLGRSIDGVRRPLSLHAVCVFVPTVMLVSVFSVLLVLMIIMAVCVYKPLTRR